MDSKAEHLVQNIGAIAEAVSVFYNSIIKQVPKDVALVLTQHYMDNLMSRRTLSPGQIAQAAALAQDIWRSSHRSSEQSEGASASPKTPEPPAQPEATQPPESPEPPQTQPLEPEK